jgi:hypothetical protein
MTSDVFREFDRYCEHNNISDDDTPKAFEAFLQEREPNTGCHAFVARKAGVYEHAGGIVMGPRYLGDGVYVAIERGMLKLYTSDGISETNVIFLEPSVMDALMDYYREAAQEPKQ